jgi:peptidyl-tRNA hydrolase, PTH1 family
MTMKTTRTKKQRPNSPLVSEELRLLVGLGNPGPKYAATRHNFGFLLLDQVSQLLRDSESWEQTKAQEISGLGRWEQFDGPPGSVHLLWPLTFMNLSGQAVEGLLTTLAAPELDTRRDVLVVIDDLSLPLGRLRIRSKGSPGGHNGLKSIQAHLDHDEYPRLKLGIGRPSGTETVVDYVLEPFSSEEITQVGKVLHFAAPEAVRWLAGADVSDLSQTVNGWSAPVAAPEEECAKAE